MMMRVSLKLKTARDGFPCVRIQFSDYLDHDLVFCTRCTFLEIKRNLSDTLHQSSEEIEEFHTDISARSTQVFQRVNGQRRVL